MVYNKYSLQNSKNRLYQLTLTFFHMKYSKIKLEYTIL